MRRVIRTTGWLLTGAGAALCLVGLSTLPSGGLMFALPFVFLMPGALLVAIGGLLLFSTRRVNSPQNATRAR